VDLELKQGWNMTVLTSKIDKNDNFIMSIVSGVPDAKYKWVVKETKYK